MTGKVPDNPVPGQSTSISSPTCVRDAFPSILWGGRVNPILFHFLSTSVNAAHRKNPLSRTAATSLRVFFFFHDLPPIVPSSPRCSAPTGSDTSLAAASWPGKAGGKVEQSGGGRIGVRKRDCQEAFPGSGSASYDLGKQSRRQRSEQVAHIITSSVCTL